MNKMEEILKQQEEMIAQMGANMDIAAIQQAMMAAMGGQEGMTDFAADLMAQNQNMMDFVGAFDEADGISDQELEAFLSAHPVPAEMQPYMMIGALLIGTNDEPYTTLALTGEKEAYRNGLEADWGIENRTDALEMLESLLAGRHSNQFDNDYAVLRQHGVEGYFAHVEAPAFDQDDLEAYQAAQEALTEILEIPTAVVMACATLLAWDLDRVGLLARTVSHAGYITETEAFDWLQKAGKRAAKAFDSWQEYFVSILLGRALHLGVHEEPFTIADDLLTESSGLLEKFPIASLA